MTTAARHPRGLWPLFFTELWERFSFYGMNALLVLYLVLPESEGGPGYSPQRAVSIYGNYVMSVYFLSVLGGYLADRWLGAARTVLIGAIVITLGHACMAVGTIAMLMGGMVCVALGTGLLKPNISVLVGRLYSPGDPRRDAGFSLFYMGINVGALAAPIVCGYLAQGAGVRHWLAAIGADPRDSWHWGFAAAGIGMLFGLLVFIRFRDSFDSPAPVSRRVGAELPMPRREGLRRLGAIGFFCTGALVFFSVLKQAGSTMSLFADRFTRNEILGFTVPSSWYQALAPAFVVLLAPLMTTLWMWLGSRQPPGPVKLVLGMLGASLSLLVLMLAANAAVDGLVSPLWLVGVFLVLTVGELCLSPIGLSNITQLAPPKLTGVMIAAWFAAIGLGAKVASLFAARSDFDQAGELAASVTSQALLLLMACVLMGSLLRWVLPMMREIGAYGDRRQ